MKALLTSASQKSKAKVTPGIPEPLHSSEKHMLSPGPGMHSCLHVGFPETHHWWVITDFFDWEPQRQQEQQTTPCSRGVGGTGKGGRAGTHQASLVAGAGGMLEALLHGDGCILVAQWKLAVGVVAKV